MMLKFLKNFGICLIAPALSLMLFALLFQLWKVDLTQPILSYGGDSFFVAFVIKTIINFGWFFYNDSVGWPHFDGPFLLHDFPIQADSFHFLIIKFLSLFSSNPFLVLNYFFISSFALVALTAFVALRVMSISVFTAILVAVLYAFSPYHLARGISHAFLSNYAVIPLLAIVALWFAEGKIQFVGNDQKGRLHLVPNKFFFLSFLIGIFSALNGVYYAIYGLVIFTFAWFLCGLRQGNIFDRRFFSLLGLLFFINGALFLLYLPSLFYWLHNGFNEAVANRSIFQSESFALKPINLLLPVANHYLSLFSNLRKIFDDINTGLEDAASSIGTLSSAGFLFSLLWIFTKIQDGENSFIQKMIKKFSLKKDDENLIANLSALNLFSVLFASVGGLVMLVAIFFPLLRSHARFSIFIDFFSLVLVAIIFDKIIKNKTFGKKILTQFLAIIRYGRNGACQEDEVMVAGRPQPACHPVFMTRPLEVALQGIVTKFLILSIAVLALFDQVGRVSAASLQSDEVRNKFAIESGFVAKIEKVMPQNSLIFAMPITGFPEDHYDLLAGYLYSSNLRWSYPAITGRSSYLWQEKVSELSAKNLVAELKKHGFAGIYLDRNIYAIKHGKEQLESFEAQLKLELNAPLIISDDTRLIFFRL